MSQRSALWFAPIALLVACVHVPDSIKQEFRPAEPDEASNYQAGRRGSAPPADASDPWSRYAAAQAAADAGASTDAGVSADAGAETEPAAAPLDADADAGAVDVAQPEGASL